MDRHPEKGEAPGVFLVSRTSGVRSTPVLCTETGPICTGNSIGLGIATHPGADNTIPVDPVRPYSVG